MRQLKKLRISHPLAHCEAAKAYYYDWAKECNAYPAGHRIRVAAQKAYKHHITEDCEICIEVLEGLHASNKAMPTLREAAQDDRLLREEGQR